MEIRQTKEEIANTLTHLTGMLLMPLALVLLMLKDNNSLTIFAIMVFCISGFLMYTASTLYHWSLPGETKRILRYFDHINIYMLIAASYTPILLCAVGGVLGWIMFGVIWGIALLGTFFKIFFLGKYPKLSLALYLIMGWSIIIIAPSIWKNLSSTALIFLLLEGIFYSSGCYFYANDSKVSYYHAVWHLFVLGGTLSHLAAVWYIL